MPSSDESRRSASVSDSQVVASADDLALWARAKVVFLEALERPDAERGAFVRDACGGDLRLIQEVESLLESDQAAANLWEAPAVRLLDDGPASAGGLTQPRLRVGARVGSYEIREFIAAGGMGEVYRAQHTVLGREVAIKTLVGDASGEAAARRLIREARHASVLEHPNICTIYEVGEDVDAPFIVMQYVAGRPLSAIVRERLPSVDTSLGYAMQIADALEHAHQHGIVHRDLKSSNIVVDPGGQPIVLDFGLAKRLPTGTQSQSREPTITAHDSVAGTLSHMAPEVLLGAPADARSDVWSLGVLLYELTTGELPFTGRTPYETSSAILGEPPRPMRGRVPLALRLVIERCLAKEPGRRYQRAVDVRTALDAIKRRRAWPVIGRVLIAVRRRTLITTGGALAFVAALAVGANALAHRFEGPLNRVTTLAVLPLRNAAGDRDVAYYADGVTEALTTQLGAASSVRIIARASAARVAAQARTVRDAGKQLGADAVLEGAVRKAGERVEIDVHLVQPATGRVLWSDHFERDAADVLALEADVVRSLAVAVRLTLRADARDRLTTVRAVAPAAYEQYLKGRYEWNNRTPRSLQVAIEHYRRAIEMDPTYAPAHAALADCYNQLGTVMVGAGSPQEFRPRASAEAIKALQLDPNSAEAHAALGYVYHYDWRWADAEKEFRRAIELNPNYSLVRIWYANLLMSRRRMPQALEQAFAARELDPFSQIINTNVGWVLDFAGRHEDAVRQLRRVIDMDSSYVQAHWRLTDALMHLGRFGEAIDEGKRLVALSGGSAPALGLLAAVYANAHEPDRARAIVAALLARSRQQYVPAWSFAGPLVALGEKDAAATWLEKGFAERSNGVAYLLADPDLAALHGHPRYEAIVARVGLK
jgi:serine/threonine-protein kinase